MSEREAVTRSAIRTVGVIGAGRMGQPIIGHLARKGFTVRRPRHRRRQARGGGEAGRRVGRRARRRSRARGDAILVCVGYDRELRELMSAGGLARGTCRAARSWPSSPRCIRAPCRSSPRRRERVRRARGRFHGLPRRPRGGRGHAAVVRRRRCGRRRAPEAGARVLLAPTSSTPARSAPRRWPRRRTTS